MSESELKSLLLKDEAMINKSSMIAYCSDLDPLLLPPTWPIIAASRTPVTFSLPSSTNREPMPPMGLEVFCGVVNAVVTPFDLFHGIKVELGLNAS